jgi:formate hydrogenlyase transcriptional activator
MGAYSKPEDARRPTPVEDTLRRVIDTIPCLVTRSRPDGYVDFANMRWLEFTGLKLEEVLGWGWRKVLHPDDVERCARERRIAFAAGQPFEAEARLRRADGVYRWFLIRHVPLRDQQENILKWYGTCHDVEDFKEATERLRQSEAELLQIINAIPAHVFILEPDPNFPAGRILPNRQDLEYTGRTLEEARAHVVKVLHPEDRERLQRLRERALVKGIPFEAEARVRSRDGQYRWFLIRVNPLKNESGRILRWYGTRTDIEDQKRAEDHLRLVIDTIPQQIWSVLGEGSPDFSLDFCNAQWRSYTGLTPEELQGEGWQRILHPDDRERVLKAWRESAATGKPFEQEVRRRGADGQYRWFLGRGVPLKNSEGRVVRWYGTNTDIEDRKEAEDRIRLVVDTTPAMLYSARPDGDLDFFNKRWLDYLGRSLDDISGWNWTSAVHPDDLQSLIRKWRHSLATGEPYVNEARVRRADGEYRWMLLQKVPLRDQAGNIVEWYGSGIDIEEQHEARTALQKAFDEIKALKDQLYKENLVLKEEIGRASTFEEIIGSSAAIRHVLVLVGKVAPTDSTVLITGETGSGKELIARAIHQRSNRKTKPFISVNCAAIPPSLVASELFGSEKGAFTGAIQLRLGRFELADGGTLFLDEIGDLPPETQIALLRVLQERTFERVGSSQPFRVNVRVLAATNRDLQTAVAAGQFRQDLFYRLNVFPIHVPPLRDRVEDIPLLVEYFVKQYAKKTGKKIRNIKRKTLQLLQAYDWPGNIRELQNVVERAVILSDEDTLVVDEKWLQHDSPRLDIVGRGLGRLDENQEREMIESALKETRGRVSGPGGAAEKLGIPRSTLESRIRRLEIDKRRVKSS